MAENEKNFLKRAWDWRTENIRDPIRSTDFGGAWGDVLDRTLFAPINYLSGEGYEDIKDWAQDAPVKWWQSYDDTPQGKIDRAKDLLIDMPAHGIVNMAQWVKDLGTQGGEAGLNWMKGRPLFTNEQKYKWDAWEGNPIPEALRKNQLWEFTGTGDNPYENPVYDEAGNFTGDYNNQAYLRMKADSERRAKKEFNEKIFTPEVEKKIREEVDKAMPFSAWSRKNKHRPQSEYYKDKWEYEQQLIGERYDDKFRDLYLKNMDRSFMEDYQIGYTDDQGRRVGDKGAFSDWDWSEDQWRPSHSMFGYNTDDKRFLRQMEIIPELAADIYLTRGALSTAKQAARRGAKLFGKGTRHPTEGIKGALRIEDKNKFRNAEEWLDRASSGPVFNKPRDWGLRRGG